MFFIELFKRIGSSSPAFFKKIMWAMLFIGIGLGIFDYLLQQEGLLPIDPKWLTVWKDFCTKGLYIVSSVLATAGVTTTKPELIDNKTKERIIEHVVKEQEMTVEPDIHVNVEDLPKPTEEQKNT